jgi:hypothetical protein
MLAFFCKIGKKWYFVAKEAWLEWLKAPLSKSGRGESSSEVRILSLPQTCIKNYAERELSA